MKNYVDLEKFNIEFKNLLSGPAQVGRMLNYIIYTGNGILKHKPGNRKTTLENNIGSAWAIEFMIGLQFVKLGAKLPNSEVYRLELTEKGKAIFNLLQSKRCKPDLYEGNSVDALKDDLKKRGLVDLYNLVEKTFRESAVFKNLCIYLDVETCQDELIPVAKGEFNDKFFAEMLLFYEHQELNLESRTSTGANRVPSLVQMCEFLNYCTVSQGEVVFIKSKLLNGNIVNDSIVVSQEELIRMIKTEDSFNQKIKKLAEEYGEEGTTVVTSTTRLSQVQTAFRDRLINEYGQHCMVCGMNNKEVLIASHIKPASVSNIYEKADNNNGLLLCANHDKLFDRFLISFNFIDGTIMISDKLTNHDKRTCCLSPDFRLPQELLTPERCEFLMWHNNEFYQKNDK
ncbi:MAG: HNH endonuclease [Clostridia bacterium]|nr:HNH endonuclease [Clostridia bacterium]